MAQDIDWYRSTVDPITRPLQNFGQGSFTVQTNLPATLLRAYAGSRCYEHYGLYREPLSQPRRYTEPDDLQSLFICSSMTTSTSTRSTSGTRNSRQYFHRGA